MALRERPITRLIVRAGVALLLLWGALALLAGLGARLLDGLPRQQLAYYGQGRQGGAIYLLDVPRGLSQVLYPTRDWVFSLAWSPDGEQLAFTLRDTEGRYRLYTFTVGEGQSRMVTDFSASNQPVAWSRDGTHIIFESLTAARNTLYSVEVSTGQTRLLLRNRPERWSTGFSLSPEGERAAFAAFPQGGDFDIYILSGECFQPWEGCEDEPLASSRARDDSPVWAGDGQRIAFLSDRTGPLLVYTLDADCAGAARAGCDADARPVSPTLEAYRTSLAWSPSVRWLVFGVAPGGFGSTLYLADMACADCEPPLYRVTPDGEADLMAAWSPDGRTLAYISRRFNLFADVAVLDAACADTPRGCLGAGRRLTDSTIQAWYPVWRP